MEGSFYPLLPCIILDQYVGTAVFLACVYILSPRGMVNKMVLHVGSEDIIISNEFHHGGNSPSVHALVALAGWLK